MKIIPLTDDQKQFVIANYDKMDLLALTRQVFNNDSLDGRSVEGRSIRKFLAEMSLEYKTTKFVAAPELELTPEQKEYIKNNVSVMNPLEMAKILFNNVLLTNLNRETIAINKYVETLPPEIVRPYDAIPDSQYQAPKATSRVISKINKYCNLTWKEHELGSRELECCDALIRYLNGYRFLYMINAYKKEKDRDLFESQFISHTFDKPDLLSEELNSYLNLCAEYIIMANAQEQKEILDDRMRTLSQDEAKKMSMTLNEAIADKSEEISSSINRQKALISDLVGKRSTRIKDKYNENAALTNFFELWKNKMERDTMIKIAKQRQLLIKDEIKRLDSLDEMMAKIQGLSEDEILF